MPDATISAQARTLQSNLNHINAVLERLRTLAQDIGLAPFRIAHIQAALDDNSHAWQELNELATALELTGADLRRP